MRIKTWRRRLIPDLPQHPCLFQSFLRLQKAWKQSHSVLENPSWVQRTLDYQSAFYHWHTKLEQLHLKEVAITAHLVGVCRMICLWAIFVERSPALSLVRELFDRSIGDCGADQADVVAPRGGSRGRSVRKYHHEFRVRSQAGSDGSRNLISKLFFVSGKRFRQASIVSWSYQP